MEGGGGDSLNESVTITDNRPSQDTLTQTIRPYDQKSDIVVIYSIGKIWISPGWDQSLSIACGVQGEQMGGGGGGVTQPKSSDPHRPWLTGRDFSPT